mgnify:CR=1 FL=1
MFSFKKAALAAVFAASATLAAAENQTIRVQEYPGVGNLLLKVAISKGFCDERGITCEPVVIPSAALGAQAFFMAYAGEETKIKKPNDIYWRDRKAGGILIENLVRGAHWTWTVIGIGLNINQTHFSNEAGNPVSLKQITGKDWDVKTMQKKLAASLSASLNLWLTEGEALTLQKMELQLIKKISE